MTTTRIVKMKRKVRRKVGRKVKTRVKTRVKTIRKAITTRVRSLLIMMIGMVTRLRTMVSLRIILITAFESFEARVMAEIQRGILSVPIYLTEFNWILRDAIILC
jgi:ribosomal protein S20